MLYSSSLRRLSCLRFLGCNTESGNKAASGKRKAEVEVGSDQNIARRPFISLPIHFL